MKHVAFVGLGSNLDNPVAQVSHALDALDNLPQTSVLRRSSLYRSAPVGYLEQPDFVNAVAQLETELTPRALLDALLALELESGRTREFCNAPRTLDLDVLLYDDLQHHEHGLTIPHSQMHLRAFVLQPLLEKLMKLSRETGAQGPMGFGPGGPGGPGGPPSAAGQQPASEVAKAAQTLQNTLSKSDATTDEVTAGLKALRAAREKASQELEKTKAAVLELVTPRQEAQLVKMGILD